MKNVKRQLALKHKDWLMAALESVGDGVITYQLDGKIDFVNYEALCILGLSLDQALNQPFDAVFVIHDEHGNPIKPCLESENLPCRSRGLPHRASYLRTDGASIKLSAHFSPLVSPNGVQQGNVVIFRDVTQIVKAEEALENERQNLDNLFELLPTAMLVIDSSAVVWRVNQAFLSIFGLSKAQILDKPFGDAIGCVFSFEKGCGMASNCMYCNFRKSVMDIVALKASIKDKLIQIRYRHEERDKNAWLSVNMMPIEQGGEVNYVVTLVDVTTRIEHEKQLEDARKTSLSILDSLPVMIYRTRSDKSWDFMNETFRQHFGLSAGDFTEAIKPYLMEADYLNFKLAFENAMSEQSGFNIEMQMRMPAQDYRTVLAIARPYIDAEGAFSGLIGLFLDVHDARMAERLYRQSQSKYFSLFRNLESSISYHKLITDETGRVSDAEIIEVNDTTERLFGISPSNLIGRCLSDLDFLSEGERNGLLESFGQVAAKNENVHVEEYYLGVLGKWVELSLYSPEEDYIAMLVSDIDYKKRAELDLKNAMERSEEANRAKSEFLANMSHEIRTPLNGIVGMLDLTMLEPLNPHQIDNLMTAKGCVQSLIDIINDVLDFAKIEAGKLRIDEQSFNLIEMAEELLRAHKAHALEKKLDLKIQYEGISHGFVLADAKRLKQVMNNLIGNAVKFTNEGSVVVSVTQRAHESSPELLWLRISVADTGIGIPIEKQGMLFKSFTQIDGSYTRQYGGTGLGLVITKQLLEMMQGDIAFTSEHGKGSTFTFEVPVQKADRPHQTAKKPEEQTIFRDSLILLVEDDRVNQIVISKIMESFGVAVDVANNGEEAIEKFKEKQYDLILMDIQMPVMDGIQATIAIRNLEGEPSKQPMKLASRTPIVALTAFALKGDEALFKASGMDDYLSKPVDRAQMMELMKKYLVQTDKEWEYVRKLVQSKNEASRHAGQPMTASGFEDSAAAEIEKKLLQLRTAFDEANVVMLEVIAHQLKQLFESQNAEELKNLTFKMELEIRKDRLENVPDLMTRVERMWQMICGRSEKEAQ